MAIAIGVIILLYVLFFVDKPYVTAVIALPFIVYSVVKKRDKTRVSVFNNKKLKGRTRDIVRKAI